MKKYALVLILVLVIGFTAGCLGGGSDTTTSSPTVSSSSATTTPTTTSQSPTTATSQSPTETPKEVTTDELFQWVSAVNQYTYVGNATISMVVAIKQENVSQRDNVTLNIIERGYIDFESWSASINTTTISVPDGASTNTSRIVVNNVTYILTPVGWVKSDDQATAEFVWKYNIVSLAREYLKRTPDERENSERLVLRYHLRDYEVRPLAIMYFATTPDTEISVKDSLLELYFENGRLVGGRISFSVSAKTSIDDPTIGKMTITQDGSWSEAILITSTNEKKNVEAPST
ncbi:hypothetical protein [Thermococcus thioreducens]|uniref:Uncharacterized protein n=1 Tax=Thermococcus thioreducens TaxID=277988 RepID=A0A0Q2MPQ2_9EURY|nr:hypothetical protein [Thermococcus thioreducens]ASJ13466.1 hypothetical protein A3L14_11505 [Thermococcus thioreducens]KQH81655.1 hypothetical protein AMR53_10140 [Thermococcus thioreducens]SEV96795.1 hypothetical protein SAMN05216170_1149 [Thermococcus thioreducens]